MTYYRREKRKDYQKNIYVYMTAEYSPKEASSGKSTFGVSQRVFRPALQQIRV